MATMTTVSSRRANCPMPIPGEAATKNNNFDAHMCVKDCNGLYPETLMSIHWRASLVPAAAVIPAPRAYINVVAVKKPVVGFENIACEFSSSGVSAPWNPDLTLRRCSVRCGNGHLPITSLEACRQLRSLYAPKVRPQSSL